MRSLQDEVEEHSDATGELRKQVLWSMSQQVRAERLVIGRQLVGQGFAPALGDQNIETAMQQRDQWIMRILMEHTHTPLLERRLAFKASHATAVEAFHASASSLLKKPVLLHLRHGRLAASDWRIQAPTITVKRQQAAYLRLVSAPTKACVDILTRHDGRYQGNLRPNWKEGTGLEMTNVFPELLSKRVVNPERAKITMHVTKQRLPLIEEHVDNEIRKLQFGSALADKAESKGDDIKGAGKGKRKKGRKGIPVDEAAF